MMKLQTSPKEFREWSPAIGEMDYNPMIDDLYEWCGNFPLNDLLKGRVFMQYTGLKDKNGKKVFEGDLLKFDCYGDAKSPVYFRNGGHLIDVEADGILESDTLFYLAEIHVKFQVIGNIFQNPELLEQS